MPIWVITKEIAMNEFEQKLDDLLDRLGKVLTADDMDILYYACGKTKLSSEKLRDLFIDIGNIFGESKK